MEIRDTTESDIPAVASIYGHHVLTGLASFEETAPGASEMLERYAAVRMGGFPFLVAVLEGQVVGYAYASHYRTRPAYRFTVEDSVYVRDGFGGRGIGMALLQALVEKCRAGPWRQMIAVIGDSANHASIELHRRAGFRVVGTLDSVGFKFGRWVDSVLMQREI